MLELLRKPTIKKPLVMTFISDQGLGKTSLAAAMLKPVFICTEDGTASIAGNKDVSIFPLAASSTDVIHQLDALLHENHGFKTVVIDSVTALHTLIEAEILGSDPKAKSISQALGGYGAGYKAASEQHRRIAGRCTQLRYKKSMNVVYLAHVEVSTFTPADNEPYNKYILRMHRDSSKHYTDDVDVIARIRLKTQVSPEGKRALSSGEREIVCYAEAASIAKNRYNITQPLAFKQGENPIITAIKKERNNGTI